MSLRNKVTENPAILVVAVLIPLALAGYLLWGLWHPTGELLEDLYYTTDEGKTVFVDHQPPRRKDALIAIMYTCDNNKTKFVHCLIKTTEEPFTPPGSTVSLKRRVPYIKKLGDTEWISATNQREWTAILKSVKCPPGTGEPIQVTPYGMAVKIQSAKGGAK